MLKKLERKTCRTNGAFNQGALIIPNNGPMIDWRRLEKMLDANDPGKLIYYLIDKLKGSKFQMQIVLIFMSSKKTIETLSEF